MVVIVSYSIYVCAIDSSAVILTSFNLHVVFVDDTFVNTRRELEEEQSKRFKAEQDQIQHMKDYVAKFGQGNAKMARQAQSKEKTLEKMVRGGLTEKVEKEKALDFVFPDPGNLAPPVLQCNDITFGYPGCPILYSNVDFGVDLDSRIAL